MLDVTDTELAFFKNDVTDYSKIEEKIKNLKIKIKPFQDEIKSLQKIKIDKQKEVLDFMETHELDMCNTENSSYEIKESKVTKQLTKGDIYDKLYDFFSKNDFLSLKDKTSEEISKVVHDFIYKEDREVNTKKVLKSK
tara:strand:+ start:60 stop:473 length:414 start_codon:yes stop_codon:yes gene_type:complete